MAQAMHTKCSHCRSCNRHTSPLLQHSQHFSSIISLMTNDFCLKFAEIFMLKYARISEKLNSNSDSNLSKDKRLRPSERISWRNIALIASTIGFIGYIFVYVYEIIKNLS